MGFNVLAVTSPTDLGDRSCSQDVLEASRGIKCDKLEEIVKERIALYYAGKNTGEPLGDEDISFARSCGLFRSQVKPLGCFSVVWRSRTAIEPTLMLATLHISE